MAYLRTIKLSIPPNQSEILAIQGNVLGVVSSSVPLNFEFDNPSAQVTLQSGQEVTYYENSVFNKISVWHGSVSEQFIEIVVGKDARLRQEKSTSDVNITSSVPLEISNATITASDVEITQKTVTATTTRKTVTAAGIAVTGAADKNRVTLHMRNTSATDKVYLSAGGAANKDDCEIIMEAGDILLIDNRSAAAQWVGYVDSADVDLIVLEVKE